MPIIFTEENKVIYECISCNKQYVNKAAFLVHDCVEKKKVFICSKCGRSFLKERSLIDHTCSKALISKVSATKKKAYKFNCSHCDKKFQTSAALEDHMCEKKKRFLAKDEELSRRGRKAHEIFYTFSLNKKVPPTITEFINSRNYTDFMDFAKFTIDRDLFNWQEYEKFLIKHTTPIYKWNKLVTYNYFMKAYIKEETWETAISRSIAWIINWCAGNEHDPREFFTKAPMPAIVLGIQTGRISPWAVLLSDNAEAFMNRLSSEQAIIVARYIDQKFWKFKIEKYPDIVYSVKDTLKDYEI